MHHFCVGIKNRIIRLLLVIVIFATCSVISFAEVGNGIIIGNCSKVLTSNRNIISYGACVEETDLGVFCAEAIRSETMVDIAIVLGCELHHNLKVGDITDSEIYEIFEDDSEVLISELHTDVLYLMVEHAVSKTCINEEERVDPDTSAFDGFIQPAGFSFTYDCSSLPGSRLKEIVLDNGTVLDRTDNETVIRVALSSKFFDDELGFSMVDYSQLEKTGLSQANCVISYIQKNPDVSTPKQNRIEVIGTADNSIINKLSIDGKSVIGLLPFVIIIVVLIRVPRQKNRLRNMDGSLSKRYHDYDDIFIEE